MSTMDEEDSALEQRARALLEASAASLDGRVRSRLTQARHAALKVHGRGHSRATSAWLSWAPTGAVAAAVLGVLLYASRGPGTQSATAPAAAADDLELLADADAMQLAEDAGEYEFYEWAAASARATPAVGT